LKLSDYIPKYLIEAEKSIRKRHAEMKIINIQDENVRINKILKEIDGLPLNDIKKFAYSIKVRDVFLLVSHFAWNLQVKNARKIFLVIKQRYRKHFLKIFWQAFQQNYNNDYFNRYLYEILLNEKDYSILSIKAEQFENIKRWFQDDNILDNCTISFKENNYDLNKFSKLYNIDFSSELMISIYFEVLVNKNQELFMKQNTSDIISMLKYFTKEKYCEFTDNYLTKLSLNDFNSSVMNNIINNIGTPNDINKKIFWDRISDSSIKKFNKWLIKNTLENFFDDEERFLYWNKYLDVIEEVYHVKNKQQLFMIFKEFVAIEFGQKGNATYFYQKNYFYQYLFKYTTESDSRPNTFFKNKVNAIVHGIHIGMWQQKFDYIVRRLN
jgi:hypothetical protein